MRKDIDQISAYPSAFRCGSERRLQQSKAIGLDLAPLLPTDDSWRVDENDLSNLAALGQVEKQIATHAQGRNWIGDVSRGSDRRGGEIRLDCFQHGLEQSFLAGEVMIERATAHPGVTEHLCVLKTLSELMK
jgi:hypothetical protein